MPTTTSADGTEIAYDVRGSGPPLVLVHGITESRHSWDPLVDDLAADHTVVAVDLRGHGASGLAAEYGAEVMASDVAAVVAAEGLADPLVVGHSLGGIVATALAGAHPCRAVVNIDQSIALGDFQELVRGAEPMLRSDAFAEVIGALFDSMVGALPPDEVARVAALRQPRQEVVLGVWSPLLELAPDVLDAYVAGLAGAVAVPYLALHGIDPGEAYAPWLASVIPSASVEVWDGDGHYPHLVHRERFLERLRRFETTLA
ncbi:MAG: alpha/beta fold hydrolase [Acidimicrobiales bacterium]